MAWRSFARASAPPDNFPSSCTQNLRSGAWAKSSSVLMNWSSSIPTQFQWTSHAISKPRSRSPGIICCSGAARALMALFLCPVYLRGDRRLNALPQPGGARSVILRQISRLHTVYNRSIRRFGDETLPPPSRPQQHDTAISVYGLSDKPRGVILRIAEFFSRMS